MKPALASIHRTVETPQQVLIRSLNTVQDQRGNAWQVILFKRTDGDRPSEISLRLVGFPGRVAFVHPHSLLMQTYQGESFEAEDLFATQSPATNAGQFDLTPIVPQLSVTRLKLFLPVVGSRHLQLSIPPSVVLEWQDVVSHD